jgi:RNA polymerase sigma-70 factor (ECF subfamily)
MELSSLINTFRGPLVGLIVSWGAPWTDATEIAQDSFSEAWLRRHACRGDWSDPDVFGPWLRGIALNRYRNWARQRRRKPSLAVASETLDQVAAPPDAEASERVEGLRRAIARLPSRQREVVLMHYLEETSVKEVAALLSVSVKTVEGRLYQARKSLHRLLGASPSVPLRKLLLCL